MGMMDKVKQAVRGKSAKLEQGIDKAVQQVDQRTKGKYGDKLTKGSAKLKEQARKLDDERRDAPGAPGPAGPSATGSPGTGPAATAPTDGTGGPTVGWDEPPVI